MKCRIVRVEDMHSPTFFLSISYEDIDKRSPSGK